MVAVLERQQERANALGRIVPNVFFRSTTGKPIKDLLRPWQKACKEARVPVGIVHDFRRTAARRLSRAGVPEAVIMGLCGWKTRSVFDRYNIIDEQDLADGLAKLARPAQTRTGTEGAQ